MKTGIREQKIISILESRGEMSVSALSEYLGVSVSTLRKQLADMQSRKLIIRTYGGVMSANRFPDETFDSKLHKSVSEKRRIATRARQLVHDGDSISLGSGTTVYALSNLLDDMDSATIYTNSMQAADFLAHCASLDVHICGGIIRSSTGRGERGAEKRKAQIHSVRFLKARQALDSAHSKSKRMRRAHHRQKRQRRCR